MKELKSLNKLKNQNKMFNKKQPIKGPRGFYLETISTKQGYDKYTVFLHVIEVERYENNYSRVILEKVEIEKGDDPDKYDWMKTCAKNKFVSIVKTDKVEWLMPTLKNDRRDKILEINKK